MIYFEAIKKAIKAKANAPKHLTLKEAEYETKGLKRLYYGALLAFVGTVMAVRGEVEAACYTAGIFTCVNFSGLVLLLKAGQERKKAKAVASSSGQQAS